MIVLKPDKYHNLNKLGVLVIALLLLIILVQSIMTTFKIAAILLLTAFACYIYSLINNYKNTTVLINDEGHWFLQINNDNFQVELNDYWILTSYLCFWLKGDNKSISILLSRRIIGEQTFSLLRSKLK